MPSNKKRINILLPEDLYKRLSSRFHDPLRDRMEYGKLTSLIIALLSRYVRENPRGSDLLSETERPLSNDEL